MYSNVVHMNHHYFSRRSKKKNNFGGNKEEEKSIGYDIRRNLAFFPTAAQ